MTAAAAVPGAPLLEVGSYCGKSSVYLGAAARAGDTVLVAIDHHRGRRRTSRAGNGTSRISSIPWSGAWTPCRCSVGPCSRRASRTSSSPWWPIRRPLAGIWSTPCALVFIDGGHGEEPAAADFRNWTPHVAPGRLPRHPRRVPRSRRRGPPPVRADLPPGDPLGAFHRGQCDRIPPGPPPDLLSSPEPAGPVTPAVRALDVMGAGICRAGDARARQGRSRSLDSRRRGAKGSARGGAARGRGPRPWAWARATVTRS